MTTASARCARPSSLGGERARIDIRTSSLAALLIGAFALPAKGHHAPTEYDFQKVIEIEGTLTEIRWQNPHVRILVRADVDGSGQPIVVDIEGGALSVMRRTNARPDGLRVGDKVRVAGFRSQRGPSRMYGRNLLQADGTELLFEPGVPPRWRKDALGSVTSWFDQRDLEKSSAGIFRVWSSRINEFFEWDPDPLPLTDAARKKAAAWDPLNQMVARGCEPVGMPMIMDHPYPIEFVQQGEAILLRMEIYDAVRTIHMKKGVNTSSLPKHLYGRSIGHWEDGTLVVATDGILWPYMDHVGTPLSAAASVIERFTPSPDGSQLEHILMLTDPENLTRPVRMKQTWIARPNETVKPYDCKPGREP